ncbi:hypothetical protein [Alkalihalobacterium elongatum]|uniref:hypothetical protein n=1 Tax=Alkalihalobacterium elongatum TaxID=2675466 RepID=UPI001C1F889C|nr:hypothetical protein [Alkalihalobacterium elongatum]
MMVEKKTKNEKVMDMYSLNWWNQDNILEDMEQRSLQAINSQKEWIEGTRDQFFQFEENAKNLTTEWKTNAQTLMDNYNKTSDGQQYHEWLNKLEEIGHKSQAIAAIPGKTSLDIIAKSNAQLEELVVSSSAYNKKMREQTSKVMDGFYDQMKEMQMGMFKPFEFFPGMQK